MTILVTGATGNVGSRLIPLLVEGGHDVRAMVRSEGRADGPAGAGATSVTADWQDPASLSRAMEGIETLFLVTPAHPLAAEWASAALTCARRSGVSRVVRLSALKASPDGPADNNRQHGRTDREVRESGLGFCILQPNFYMQSLLASLDSLRSDGALYWGLGDGRVGLVDVRDIADAAAAVIADCRWDGRDHALTGPESLSFHELADILSAVLGRAVAYRPVPPDAVGSTCLRMGLGDWVASLMRDYSEAYGDGWGDLTTGVIEQITGHPARSFEAFAREELRPAVSGVTS